MMRVVVQWILDCYDPAAKDLNELGIVTAINGETVAKWNKLFRKNERLPHPNVWVRIGKKPKPPIFELFPLLEAEVNEYVMKHLDFFTIEMLGCHVFNVMIPNTLKEIEGKGEEDSLGYKYLKTWKDKPPSYNTVN